MLKVEINTTGKSKRSLTNFIISKYASIDTN